MEICKTIDSVRQVVGQAKSNGKTVGLVPTMGALHAGHLSLIKTAVEQCDFTVVSIFVNPTQFAPDSDYQDYPQTLEADIKNCEDAGVDIVFAPSVEQMYPDKVLTWVNVEEITDRLCGKYRPGHFRGVATICAKLFNIVCPDKAFFGQKDAQQLAVIKRMVDDLNMPLEIVGCPTVREDDGLAMSSRNKYLTEKEREQASLIYAALQLCQALIAAGEKDVKVLKDEMRKLLSNGVDIKVEYIEMVNSQTLQPTDKINGQTLIAIAAYLGKARLIDNTLKGSKFPR